MLFAVPVHVFLRIIRDKTFILINLPMKPTILFIFCFYSQCRKRKDREDRSIPLKKIINLTP